jgi:hypothetical protein
MSEVTNFERLQARIRDRARAIRASVESRQILAEIKESLNKVFGHDHNQVFNINERYTAGSVVMACGTSQAAFNRLDTADVDAYGDAVQLLFETIVHFPQIEITNSSARTHRIYDLYVRFYFDELGRLQQIGENFIEGMRATGTVNEVQHHYIHSHLRMLDWSEMTFQPFCTGSGPINLTYLDLHTAYSKYGFQLFCHQLSEYVRWESIEGVPYIDFESLHYPVSDESGGPGDEEQEDMHQVSMRLYGTFNEQLRRMDVATVNRLFDITVGGARIQVKGTTELELLLAGLMAGEPEVYGNRFFRIKTSRGSYAPLDAAEIPGAVTDSTRRLLSFQNKDIYLKLIDYEASENEDKKYPHPEITDGICRKLAERANKYWFTRQLLVPGSTG